MERANDSRQVLIPTRASEGRSALFGSLLLILLATLTPGQWSATEGPARGQDAGVLLNVALFAPLGAALGHRGRSAAEALLIGALLSGSIEIIQLAVPGRDTSLEDALSIDWVTCLLYEPGNARERADCPDRLLDNLRLSAE